MAPEPKLRYVPLGGLGEVGLNMWALEWEGQVLVVDAGLMFPTEEMLGVDLVIPDVSWLLEEGRRVVGIFLTHGHEDHIGALAFVLKRLNVPVYHPAAALHNGALVRDLEQDFDRVRGYLDEVLKPAEPEPLADPEPEPNAEQLSLLN